MKTIAYLFIFSALALSANAATFSGTVKNKFGDFLGFMNLSATHSVSFETIEFNAERNGTFSVELPDGTWTIYVDSQQASDLGYSNLDAYQITIDGSDVSKDVTLLASEPLQKPSFEFELDLEADRITYRVKGQGGTRVTLFTSFDLQEWSPVPWATNTVRGTGSGFILTTSNNFNPHKRFFKVVATTE